MRRINWLPIVLGFLFVGLYYGLRMVFIEEQRIAPNHVLAWLLFLPGMVFGYWVFVISHLSNYDRISQLNDSRSAWLQLLDIIPYFFSGIALAIFSLVFLLVSEIPPDSMMPDRADSGFFELLLSMLTAYIALWTIFCRGRYATPDGKITLINNKIYWPGTKISLRPWLRYDLKIYDKFVPIYEQSSIACKDVLITVGVCANAQIDIDGARKRSIAFIDFKSLIKGIREKVISQFTEDAKNKTVRGLFLGKSQPRSFDVAGVPVIWDGAVEITTVIK